MFVHEFYRYRYERRLLFWRLRRGGDVVTAVPCDDSVTDDNHHGRSILHLKVDNGHPQRRVYNDQVSSVTPRGKDVTGKAQHCRDGYHRTTLDDSGIALEDGRISPSGFNRSDCAAATTVKRCDSDSPTTIDCSEVISKSGPRPYTSTHHWYRHKHRASQERRAMKRVAEWIDRNYSGNHGGGLHGDRSTTTDASMVIRIPAGGKLTVTVESVRTSEHNERNSKTFSGRRSGDSGGHRTTS